MGFEFWYTSSLVILMSVFLFWEILEVELTVFGVLMLLIIGDVITLKEAFAGFSNEGMLTIALLFVVAGALNNTGMLKHLNSHIFGQGNSPYWSKLLRIMVPISAISAFMNNTPVVAMMIPAVRNWADKYGKAASKFLIPISYAAIFGGMCTLIGTSTNLIVHGLMLESGMEGMGMFEISKIGVPVAIVGMLYVAMVGHRSLPDRKEPIVELGEHTREFVIELKVTPEYAQIGKSVEEAGLRHLKGLFLFQIEREEEMIAPAKPHEKIHLGDRLFFTGVPKTILELQKTPGLQLTKDSHFDLKQYDSNQIRTFECVISSVSPLVGKTVRESNFRTNYGAVIIAIHRHGQRMESKIGDIRLHPGDTLLVLASRDFRKRYYHRNDFYLIAGSESPPSRPRWQGYLSVGAFLGMLLLTVAAGLPLLASAACAVLLLILSKTVTSNEARRMVDWRVLVIIALSLGVAEAVEKAGVATVLAEGIVQLSSSFGVMGVVTAIYFLTSFYTLIMTNNATAALIFPIAISTAGMMEADPRAFAMTVVLGAAASFATPISYQTNLMVYGPGGYKFMDFVRIGIPLQIIVAVMSLFLLWVVYFS